MASGRPNRSSKRTSWLTLLAIPLLLTLVGELPARAQQLHLVHYTTAQGLPTQEVTALFQDAAGYVWVGTDSGLARYDGRFFDTVTERDGLTDNRVTAITQDARGVIWVATASGISRLLGLEPLPSLTPGLDGTLVRAVAKHGDAMLAASTDGIFRIDASGNATRLSTVDALSLAVDPGNRVWVAGNGFARRLENGVLGPPLPGIHTSVRVMAIVPTSDGDIWLATNAGAYRWNGRAFEIFRPPALETERALQVLSGAADPQGRVWLGTWGGLARISARDTALLTEVEGLPDTTVRATLADREGNVWLGTDDGLAKLVPGPFAAYTRAQGLPSEKVLDVTGDRAGGLWVATSLGPVHLLADGSLDWRGLPTALRYVRTEAVAAVPGAAMAGTADGLHVWNGESVRTFRRGAGFASSRVAALAPDDDGGVWVGLQPGIAYWRDGETTVPDGLGSLGRIAIVTLHVDGRGRVWIATDNQGVRLYDPRTDTLTPLPEAIAGLDALSFAEDRQGAIWIGSAGSGAVRYDKGEVTRYDRTTGLVDEFVQQVTVDDLDRAWLYTHRGLDRLAPDGTLTHFDSSEGLIALEGSTDAVWRQPGGDIWFGTGAGLIHYDPQLDTGAPIPPEVAMRALIAGGERLPLSGLAEVLPGVGVRIEFAGLSFRNETDNLYRYRLVGDGGGWTEPRHETEVVYGGLDPGAYRFEVLALTPDGTVSPAPAAVEFRVLPRFHQTLWFRGVAVLLLLAAAYTIYRWRAGHLEREQRRLAHLVETRSGELAEQVRATEHVEALARARDEFVAKMSHEIRTPINGVLGMTDLLLFTPLQPRQRHLGRSIKRSGEALLDLVNDILDLSKVESGKLSLETTEFDLVETIGDVLDILGEKARSKKLRFDCRIDPFVEADLLGDPVRLRQVLLNLVDNALKFTDQGSVTLVVDALDQDHEQEHVRFQVIDTGIGIPEEAQEHIFHAFEQADASTSRRHGGTGLGLNISHQLVTAMGGSIRVKSQPGEGTTFTFTARFGRQASFRPREDLGRATIGLLGLGHRAAATIAQPLTAWGAEVSALEIDPLEATDAQLTRTLTRYELVLVAAAPGDRASLARLRRLRDDGPPEVSICVLLPPGGRRTEIEEAAAHQWSLLTVPTGARRLYASIRQALSGEQAESLPGATAPVFSGAVLLVEDNPVNKEIATGLLRHLGCSVVVVDNGREAVAAVAEQSFDLVLMDCEMPVMDGFEATRAIREREKSEGKRRTAVVALTANASREYRNRCHESGMDGYLSKPHTLQELIATLASWLEGRQDVVSLENSRRSVDEEAVATVDLVVLDQIRALQQPGEPDLLPRVVDSFLETSARLRAEIEKAAQAGDAHGVRTAAHSLKSAAGNVGAQWLFQLCRRLEALGRGGDVRDAAVALQEIDEELATVIDILRGQARKVANG